MDKDKIILLAEKIIHIDNIRDQLYEELMLLAGNKGPEILRSVQNNY